MPMSIFHYLLICSLMLLGSSAIADGVPEECNQLILGIASTWNSMRGEVRLFERSRSGDWSSVGQGSPGRMSRDFERKSAMDERPREFSKSAKFLVTIRPCLRGPIIRIVRLRKRMFGAMT